jgi:hypothetical protein
MKYLSLGVLILGSTMAAGAQTPAPEGGDKILREPLTLTGCVTAGTKANTFLLTNVQRTDTPGRPAIEPAVYWLSSPAKLKGHAGHQVEIEGTLDDDVDKSEVKAEDGNVELSTERQSKTVEVREDTVAGDAMKAVATAGKIVTFKVKVKSVKMLSTICS